MSEQGRSGELVFEEEKEKAAAALRGGDDEVSWCARLEEVWQQGVSERIECGGRRQYVWRGAL